MERVLVRAKGDVGESMKADYVKMEFHMLDLKQGKITFNLMPPFLTAVTRGGVVSLGSSVFIFGGSAFRIRPLRHNRPPPGPGVKVYSGASRFDFSSNIDDDNNWKCASLSIKCEDSSLFIPLLGKIYGFGLREKCVEVFDPTLNQWEMAGPIPSPFDHQCGINKNVVLPDPKNRRIIVSFWNQNLNTTPLCFYYPPLLVADTDTGRGRGRWECISNDFPLCDEHVAALVDDVLYIFHENQDVLLRAYDLATSRWLDVSWTTTLPDGAVKEFYIWDTLFVLHDNVMCFASWSTRYDPFGMEITLLKFKVERTSSSTIHATYLDGQAYDIPNVNLIYDLTLLDQEASLSADRPVVFDSNKA